MRGELCPCLCTRQGHCRRPGYAGRPRQSWRAYQRVRLLTDAASAKNAPPVRHFKPGAPHGPGAQRARAWRSCNSKRDVSNGAQRVAIAAPLACRPVLPKRGPLPHGERDAFPDSSVNSEACRCPRPLAAATWLLRRSAPTLLLCRCQRRASVTLPRIACAPRQRHAQGASPTRRSSRIPSGAKRWLSTRQVMCAPRCDYGQRSRLQVASA